MSDTLMVDRLRWILSPAGRGLFSPKDLNLEEHVAADRATTVKHGEHRTVYRVELPQGAVYWKHCRLNGPRAWWRDLLRGPKAKLEFDRARELRSRGIGTVEPLAWARFDQRRPAGSFLVTRAMEGTVPLDEYLDRESWEGGANRRALTVQLAAFIRKLHDAGVTHPDLHPGNLLVKHRQECSPLAPREGSEAGTTGEDVSLLSGRGAFLSRSERATLASLEFFLIDVHDLLLGPPLGPRARLQNLVLFNRWFAMRATRTDRSRFWHAYAGEGAPREDALRIEEETFRSNRRLWANRDLRCLRANRTFRQVRGAASGFALRELDAAFADQLAADPDAPFDRPDAKLLKNSRSATVSLLQAPTANGPRAMVYKRFKLPDWTDPLANLFRPTGALRSWLNGHALIARGQPTPLPYLVLHRRSFGMPTVGYLLCEKVEDARLLHEAIAEAGWPAKRELLERLARWVRLMHERGVSHRDLKAANILVTSANECSFIDLVGVRLGQAVPVGIRVRDLTRLSASFVNSPQVTRSDRLRFLRIYLAWGLRGSGGWKDWWKRVGLATQAKIERNARRNRPLA